MLKGRRLETRVREGFCYAETVPEEKNKILQTKRLEEGVREGFYV